MILKILQISFLILFSFISNAYAMPERCIAAYDFGLGGAFLIKANPDEGNSGASRLVQSKPYRDQIASWVPTYLSTTGTSQSSSSAYGDGKLKVYIAGQWGPWGGDVENMKNQCDLRPCDPSKAADAVCLSGGLIVDMKPDGSNVPCKLENGIGLYGLVALDVNGKRYDPNDPAYARALPNKYFRTFRMWPLQEDSDGKYFELNFTQQCDGSDAGGTVCIGDKDAAGQDVVAKGSLYFKILDRYYQDNTGGYEINVVSGVISEKGFIETVIESFTKIMMNVAQKMYIAITSDFGFITAVKALLVLYVSMTGLLFMMGMLNINQGELLVRIFKIALITILISDTSWDFFNKYLFSLFTEGAASIGAIVTKATFGYSNDYGFLHFILTDTSSPLSVFDSIINVIKNPNIHCKIAALLLYNYYYFLYIVFIYLCIYILILAIIRGVVLYITAVLFIALMLIIA
ncbi:MAG: type IV secretion system protein, partial [Candidatus Jidaibacter sp.]|nr:type IV secretion system protein [Candidatus Jidaibacter sp.]